MSGGEGVTLKIILTAKTQRHEELVKIFASKRKQVKANLCDLASLRGKEKSISKPLRRSVFAVKEKK